MAYPIDRDPLAGSEDSNTTEAEGGDPAARMAQGIGQAERNRVDATRKGLFPDDQGGQGGDKSQGEWPGAGSIFSAQLNERPNLSNPRNQGPERSPSRQGASRVPVVTVAQRNTGKVGG